MSQTAIFLQSNIYAISRSGLAQCSFCYQEQNERNDIPFVPKTE